MIARFAGRCSICREEIPKGAECEYDPTAKTVHHYECAENPKPGPEAYELAERLGYRKIDALERN